MAEGPILTMRKIDKRFTGVHALRQVGFDLEEGEIHALVGENGAGKSTLMKVLIGINPKDSGEIRYLGHLFNPRSPKHALEMGIGIVHQELNMMDHLTVAENIFIGRETTKAGGLLLDKREQEVKEQKHSFEAILPQLASLKALPKESTTVKFYDTPEGIRGLFSTFFDT